MDNMEIGSRVNYKERYLIKYYWLERGVGTVVGTPGDEPFELAHSALVEWDEKPGEYHVVYRPELEVR